MIRNTLSQYNCQSTKLCLLGKSFPLNVFIIGRDEMTELSYEFLKDP